ncbi:Ubiquitin-conjugating enzyme/RWD-like [Arabidopsis thaliana x Arabidopsis arenosa]|nr:Ubiquitin-conjugating enzyme/RWD-like [Arabidopsis thaliana x Arabidopsis arenosa]KAG7638387.1 Ubiquitin-conjugating enzyme/RWD-like [Arabidopsis thaliana x Arabidopsis arenosa]KAG7643004.1 Ubiquitin-conjugating enzyme/RWD-like [Arabidopsis suecica]
MEMSLTDSDWDSSSDSGSSEHEEVEFSYGGRAQNIFSNLEETIGKIDEFLSFERGFMYGDIVRSATEPSGQSGRVINIDMFVNLESTHGKIMKEVDTKRLQKLRSISLSDYVINGPWLGRVDKIVERVSVTLDDGTNYEVLVDGQDKLVAIPPNLLEDSQYSYYPGQRVQVKLAHAPRSTTWLCGTWRGTQVMGTVCTVEAGLVYVDWVASIVMEGDRNLTAPQALQNPESLTLLPCVSHASWQLGDWCILPGSSHCDIAERQTPNVAAYNLNECHKTFQKGFTRNMQNSGLDELFVITKTKMKVAVMWQDGSCSLGVDSQQLLPVGAVNAHDFWPEQFVVEKETCNSKKWGVVKAVNAKEQTVKVQWTIQVEKEATGCVGEVMEEIVSAYELLEHPDFGFCFSDVVVKLLPEGKFDPNADTIVATEAKHLLTESDYSGAYCLSSIGVVTGFKNGSVKVKWANGSTSKVAPCEIWKMERSEYSNSSTVSSEGSVQDLSQKISQSDEASSNHQETGLVKLYSVGESRNENIPECSSFFLPKAAIGFITNLASSLFGYQGSTSVISSHSRCNDSEDQSDSEVLVQETAESYDNSETNSGEVDMTTTMVNIPIEGKGINRTLDSTLLENSRNQVRFRQFDMVNDCSDHHFLSSDKGLAQSQVTKSWVKKVQQEWSNLEANLPNTIYVRVCEERMDLLRAALVGAPGTPYHDGLFFFDIMLPPQYPHEPPMVHYHSGGMRLNPNLYESGRVCLSLLNTWSGSGTEVWNAGSSSILQVLLSFQALVLNEKPYFNEAGYDKQLGRAEGEKNSVSYNENAFLITCKSMISMLRKPPKHFEVLVKDHFTHRAQHVLAACKAYMEGVPVGSSANLQGNSTTNSTGFKIMLSKLYPKLLEAFSEIGVDCVQGIGPEP